jgi:hypothetical protein
LLVPDVSVALVLLVSVALDSVVVLVVSVPVEVLDTDVLDIVVVCVVLLTVVVVMFHCWPSNSNSVSPTSTMSTIMLFNGESGGNVASAANRRLYRSAGSLMLPVRSDRTPRASPGPTAMA